MPKHVEGLGNEYSWEGAVKGGFKQTELTEVYSKSAEINGKGQ